jgi:DNA-binding MarR family transcriptional regulator
MEPGRKRMEPVSKKATASSFSESLYFSAGALSREAEKLAIECFKPTGLSPSLAYIVLLLTKVRMTGPSFLAKSLFLSPSTMTRLLDKLESMGWVNRFVYDRVRMVELTRKAWQQEPLLFECEFAFRKRCQQLLGRENVWRLTKEMNSTTDNLRNKGAGGNNCRSDDGNSGEECRSLTPNIGIMNTPDAGRKVEAAYLQKAISYDAYTTLIDDLVGKGQTTGPDQSEAMIHYTQLNQQRMHRWEKTIQLLPSAEAAIRSVTLPQTWLVLTEAWCGDAAHTIPIMHALAMLNPLITLRLLLRDENPAMMDRYLTNGVSRSIPKLISLDTVTGDELFTWGPRPAVLQELFMKQKQEGIAYAALKEELQRWYNKDKTISVQEELSALAAGASGTATATAIGMTA